MRRSALASFLRNVAIAALPLAAGGCCSDRTEHVTERVDAFTVGDGGVGFGGVLPAATCAAVCKAPARQTLKAVIGCTVADTSDAGIVSVNCEESDTVCGSFLPGGRPPAGLRARRDAVADDAAGGWFAAMAHVEGAAVAGFAQLADELAGHGAPRELITAARRAADDERRHARVAAAFARQRGCVPPPVEIDAVAARSLEAIATDNAVEGCVIETFGAVVATWQGRMAGARAVRRAFANIAVDELRHSELAFAVARWAEPRLDSAARRRVRQARRAAADRLARTVTRHPPRALVADVGLPPAAIACAMLARLDARLWRA